MVELGQIVEKIRSKNAGPFWLTIDLFCGTSEVFSRISSSLSTDQVGSVLGSDTEAIRRFDIPSLNVVKFSLPRPSIQGSPGDRDIHGASWAALLAEIELS